eukprot:527776_1
MESKEMLNNNKLPNDCFLMGYSREAISASLTYKDKAVPYSVLCRLIFMYYPVIDSKPLDTISVHSYRGEKKEYLLGFDSGHPKNILISDEEPYYASEISSKFNANKPNDWIIFQNDESKKGQYYPFKLDLQNRDKWIKLKPNVMEMDIDNVQIQSFELEYEYNDWIIIKNYKLNEFKLELMSNAEEPQFIYSKFCLRYFQLHGLYS